jgi:hypothetical protein
MQKIKKLLPPSLLFVASVFFIIISTGYGIRPENLDAQSDAVTNTPTNTPTGTRLTGYAWSENIGWISFKDGSSPVKVKPDGSLTGYAWSENIGWVQFGGLSSFPNASYGTNAKLEGDKILGWARAVAGMSGQNRGGWDGWIALNNVKISSILPANPFSPSGCANGCAWGSDVIGWVDFSGVSTSIQKNSCSSSYGTVIPDGSNFTFFSPVDKNGECTTQIKSCVDGVLSPNGAEFTELSCVQNAECVRAGKTYLDGEKVNFYSKSFAGMNQTCESLSLNLECSNGQFKDEEGNVNTTHKLLKCTNNPSFRER